MIDDYESQVFAWGSANPWKDKPSLSHRDKFDWVDMTTNKLGDVLVQPLLRNKPCFGRPEYFFRHGKRKRDPMMLRGRIQEPQTRCGRCPVYDACKNLCAERVKSDAGMTRTLSAFWNDSKARHAGKLIYTGECGRFWTAFKKAVAARGPFYNVNDERLRDEEKLAAEVQLEKWRRAKRRQREHQRKDREALHLRPSPEFNANAEAERDRRRDVLLSRAGDATLPPRISRIRPADAAKTAALTANAWLVHTLQRAMGHDPKPGTIARLMVEQTLANGMSYESLKARIGNDLARGTELENLGIWPAFDADSDLLEATIEGLEADHGVSLREIIRELEWL